MFKKMFIALILTLVGCVSFNHNKNTTIYISDDGNHKVDKQKKNKSAKARVVKKRKHQCCGQKKSKKTNSGHVVTFARSWGLVTHKLKEVDSPDDYFGVSFSITNPNKFFRFQTLAMMSNTSAPDNQFSLSTASQGLWYQDSYSDYVNVDSIRKKTVFVILPILSAPLMRYDFDLRLGKIIKIDSNLELRTGVGYEWRINYIHSESNIDVLGEGLDSVYLPSSISNESYITQITTLELNLEPVHSQINYIVNRYEIMLYLSLGGIW